MLFILSLPVNYCTITELLHSSNRLSITWGSILIIGGRRGFSSRTLNDQRLSCSLPLVIFPLPVVFLLSPICMSIEQLSLPEPNLALVVIREHFLLLV